MKNNYLLKLAVGGTLFASALVLNGSQEVGAEPILGWYNENAIKEFNISKDYVEQFDIQFETGLHDYNLSFDTQYERDFLELDTLTLLSSYLQNGLPYNEFGYMDTKELGRVSNKITVHYNNGEFELVDCEDTIVANLILNFVRGVADYVTTDNAHEELGVFAKQPRFYVSEKDIDIFVPYVYYNKDTRKYLATQLANRLEVLTGVRYDVHFRTSFESTVKKYNPLNIGEQNGLFISNFLMKVEETYHIQNRYDTYGMSYYMPNKLPIYENGQYWANPSYIVFEEFTLSQYLTERGISIAEYMGVDCMIGECQRMALAELTYFQFMQPTVVRFVFSDYTVTLRAGRYLDIELSDRYLEACYSNNVPMY